MFKVKMLEGLPYMQDDKRTAFLLKGGTYNAYYKDTGYLDIDASNEKRRLPVTVRIGACEIIKEEVKVKTGTIATEEVGNWEQNILHDRPDSDHYTDSVIDVWQFADANFDYDELFGFHRINVIKYVTRFGKKNGRNIRDLEKAKAVIEEMIRMELEGE